MDTTQRSRTNELSPTVEEELFLARYFSGATCAAEISRWLEASEYVRSELAEFIEVIDE